METYRHEGRGKKNVRKHEFKSRRAHETEICEVESLRARLDVQFKIIVD